MTRQIELAVPLLSLSAPKRKAFKILSYDAKKWLFFGAVVGMFIQLASFGATFILRNDLTSARTFCILFTLNGFLAFFGLWTFHLAIDILDKQLFPEDNSSGNIETPELFISQKDKDAHHMADRLQKSYFVGLLVGFTVIAAIQLIVFEL